MGKSRIAVEGVIREHYVRPPSGPALGAFANVWQIYAKPPALSGIDAL
jgi:hypothetical protein